MENWAMSVSSSAGSALCCSLAARIASCTAASRPAGSAKLVGSAAMTDETRLPWAPFCSSVRMDTGTAVSSGPSGRASCFCSQTRSAPAHSAITTSLTVTPAAFLISLTCASGRLVKAQRRCGPMFLLNGVAGAINGGADRTTPRSRRNTYRSMSGSQGRAGLATRAGNERTIPAENRTARTGLVASGAGLGFRTPRVWLARVARLRRGVHQRCQQVVSRHPVDGRVVHLRVQGLPAALQAVDEVGLPERAAAVQRPRVQAGCLDRQLPIIPWGGQREFADMKLDVEIGVLDPVRLGQPQRHHHPAAAERREQKRAGLDELGQPLKRQGLAARRR